MSDPTPTRHGRVLLVDDEASLVHTLGSTLREHGYTVTSAANSADALAALRRERFDVLLTDLHLPEMDGIGLLRAALALDATLIGILMTGQGAIDTAVDAMKAGAFDYVLKPFAFKSVLAVIDRALAVRHLRQENARLSSRLTRRTAELEAANRELEAFSYSVSHDLRAPLRAVEGFTEALVEECEAGNFENLREYRERIARSVGRMKTMIDDLLRMAKAGQGEIVRGPVDLRELAREFAPTLQALAPARTLELTLEEPLPVEGDPGLLRAAMENLLGNAWKYSSQREVTRITVGRCHTPAGDTFFVRDNGIGFDMAESDRLFTPFQRLRSGAAFEGTGIGLATVQRIVHRHGGHLWAEAEPGKGATFFFTLPTGAPQP